jgi:dolichyl-phosphate-mannose-protein mannosyltransferase
MRRIALVAAAIVFVAHLFANPHYGFFRDELYFIICGRHPQFGYVDQPPLIPLLAAVSQLFGRSLVALRAVSALFGAASVYVTVRLVEELQGGPFAAALAAIAVALCPIVAVFGVLVGPDDATVVAWPLIALFVLRLSRGADPRLWLAAGATAGLALEAKYSAAFWLASLFVALLLTPERRLLASKWVALGGLLCAALALPSIVWQAVHHFPMLEVLAAGQRGKNVVLGPGEYLLQEIVVTNPVLALLWIAGFFWAFLKMPWLGLASALTLALVIALHGKDYYACGIFPALFAAGAVAVESWTARAPRLRPAVLSAVALAGAVFVPFIAPVLPEASFLAYQDAIEGVLGKPKPSEHHAQALLPQDYADMHGWPELTAAVERAAATLTPEERARAVIMTPNYGDASALNFFGKDLPPAASGHNQYFLWGPHGRDGTVLIDLGGDCGAHLHAYQSTRDAGVFTAPWIMPYEDRRPIRICRGLRRPLAELWPMVKHYD